MKSGKILILLTALLLVGATAVWAAQGKPATKSPAAPTKTQAAAPAKTKAEKPAPTRSMAGTVSSVSSTSLVLSRTVKGKKVETTFELNAQTEQEVAPKVGDKVTVHYRMRGKDRVATEVEGVHPRGGEAAEKETEHHKPAAKPSTSKPKP